MEYYKKVYIKSEADLPKEVGDYHVLLKTGEARLLHFPFNGDVGYNIFKLEWLKDVVYYLQPCSEKNVTDEEIKKWAKQRIREIDLDQWDVFELLIEGAKAMRDGKIPTKD